MALASSPADCSTLASENGSSGLPARIPWIVLQTSAANVHLLVSHVGPRQNLGPAYRDDSHHKGTGRASGILGFPNTPLERGCFGRRRLSCIINRIWEFN
jgi:hypothetical protein